MLDTLDTYYPGRLSIEYGVVVRIKIVPRMWLTNTHVSEEGQKR